MTTNLKSKNILGYTLQERIGSGGFGEVWSAIAPGGLRKAVKLVYGYHDEKRAQAELKALDRVKEVRHPFLLSLERIEVHEGQLIVVSELADKSLADLFNEFAAKGESGIPREELIRYTRNAAEALDYLSDEHGLQHLDIKPENLLLVSGHVKVADFGLIKDLHNASQSLMAGMTPAYAAPELFDGRPGARSDQYSLAVVYQEMLTSVRPFGGTTPAQLAAQHMHGKPNLRPLPPSDQPVIARALAKDPGVRFESCWAMAEELTNRKRSTKKAIRRINSMRERSDTESNTVSFDRRDNTALMSSKGLPFQANEIKLLDPPDCDPDLTTFQPVLVVGVGGSANRVVKRFKQQLIIRHHSMDEVPAIRVLCVDTDRSEIAGLCNAGDDAALSLRETVNTTLAKPEFYRNKANTHLNWLSRRWIYNIPRSLQTEGLRPLGRLAFADHFESICSSIDEALRQITLPENVAKSAETLELNPGRIQPRVFIVTSISGGVGSGMALDLAYTIKLMMAEHGLDTDAVNGILLHSTYQRSRDPGLSAANAFAFLTELRHYVEQGFPGDDNIGLPAFPDEPPLDFAYFNDLGHDLSQTEFEDKLNSVSEYIYLSSTSKCASFLDSCRELERDLDHFALRTFGLSLAGPGHHSVGSKTVNDLAHALVQRWLHGRSDENFDVDQFVESQSEQLGAGTDQVLEMVTQRANEAFDDDFEKVITNARELAVGESAQRIQELVEYLDGTLGCPRSRRDTSHIDPEFCTQFGLDLGHASVVAGDQITTSIMDLISGNSLELHRATSAVTKWLSELELAIQQIHSAVQLCDQQIERSVYRLSEFSLEKVLSKRDERALYDEVVGQYCQLRFEEFVLRFAGEYYRRIRNGLCSTQELTRNYSNALAKVAHGFVHSAEIVDANSVDASFNIDQLLIDSIESEMEEHVSKTEIQLFESMVKEIGGYQEMLDNATCLQHRLPGEIRTAAQRILADAYKKVSLEEVIAKNNIGPEQLIKWLNEKIREARPIVDDCGGSSRVMLAIPALSKGTALPEILKKHFSLTAKTINGTRGSFVFCFETEDVSLANVAYRLLQARPDAVELVKRIQSRNDVEWSSLNDLL